MNQDSQIGVEPSQFGGGTVTAELAPAVEIDASPASSRWRTVLAGVLGVLGVVLLTVASIGVWANATVFQSDEVSDIVAAALADPEVQSGLAAWVTDEVFTAVDVQALVTAVLPNNLQRLAPTITSGAEGFVDRRLTQALANPDVQQLLVRLVDRAHAALMDLLSGDGLVDGISVEGGAVTLNMLPLIARGLSALQELGLLQGIEVPDLSRADDPADQIAALESATGRDLPDDFGQLVVYESDKLAEAELSVQNAQRLFAFVRRATVLLAVLSVVFLGASLLLAHRRWRAALWLALGCGAAMVLSRIAVRRVVDEAPDLVQGPAGRAALAQMLQEAASGLLRLTGVIGIVAAVVIVLALFERRWATGDLLLVGGLALGLATVAILGINIGALLLGVVLATVVVVFGSRILESRRRVMPS